MFRQFGWIIQLAITVVVGRFLLPPGWGIWRWMLAVGIGMVGTWLLAMLFAGLSSRKGP